MQNVFPFSIEIQKFPFSAIDFVEKKWELCSGVADVRTRPEASFNGANRSNAWGQKFHPSFF